MKKKKTKKVSRAKQKSPVKKALCHEILYKNQSWAGETAIYFGFSPFHFPEITKDDRATAASVLKEEREAMSGSLPFLNLAERISILRNYTAHKWDKEPQPILIAYSPSKLDAKTFHFGLEIIGSPKSIADATIIKTVSEILKERGYNSQIVALNSMGDRESFGRFIKEFIAFTRKNLENIHPSCRQEFKKNALCLLSCGHEKCQKILATAPKPMNSLSEESRMHFKEVLEYLEELGISYKIEDTLVSDRTFGCQTIFKILEDEKTLRPLAAGARYNILGRRIGFKKELPAVGARIELKDFNHKIPTSRKIEKPLVCFVQIGFEAKLKSLQVIEMLREAKIPTYQSLSRDKLSSQLQIAENLRIPYTIIMGQKEAMENSVIVRFMTNRSQETVFLPALPKYLKKILR